MVVQRFGRDLELEAVREIMRGENRPRSNEALPFFRLRWGRTACTPTCTRCQTVSAGGPLITCRTSMGWFSGVPPVPWRGGWGAAEARAAILYACSGLSTSTIQYPARN